MTRYAPQWLQAQTYAASVDRRLIGALWPGPASTGCAVTTSSGMTVNVAAGTIAVPTANNTGTVLCSSDAVEPVTLAAAPGAGTNRYDVIVCQARGNDLDGGANNDFLFSNVTGTAAASPAVPATPANAVALANIYVPGGSASVTAGNIADVRPAALLPPRGLLARVVQNTDTNGITGAGSDLMSIGPIAIPAGRRIAVVHHIMVAPAGAGAGVFTQCKIDGVVQTGRLSQIVPLPANGQLIHAEDTYTPAAGNHTFVAFVSSVTANVNVGGASIPAYHEIRDLGAV